MTYNELFDYVDGDLVRKVTTSSRAKEGDVCRTPASTGYFTVRANGKKRYVHRVIWEMHNGPIPDGMYVDHINQDKCDNRIENLRLVTPSQNNLNNKHNAGVSFHPDHKAWRARLTYQGEKLLDKLFPTEMEAKVAYNEAKGALI